MRISARTLVHTASMPIARHAVRTFCITHRDAFSELIIHTDGSLTNEDRRDLSSMTGGMPFRFVEPRERRQMINRLCMNFPRTQAFLDGYGYRAKMEIPVFESEPYFYFDSDVLWLQPCANLLGDGNINLFSTESWTWYPGIRKASVWARSGVPRRVNSGFYFLRDPFPFDRMERLLSEVLYEPEAPWATDQEIMAFLYPSMRLYHPDDLMRSRRGILYDLVNLKAVALHFPGRMWEPHLGLIAALHPTPLPRLVRITEPIPLGITEITRMKIILATAQARWSRVPVELYRRIRASLKRDR